MANTPPQEREYHVTRSGHGWGFPPGVAKKIPKITINDKDMDLPPPPLPTRWEEIVTQQTQVKEGNDDSEEEKEAKQRKKECAAGRRKMLTELKETQPQTYETLQKRVIHSMNVDRKTN